MKYKNYIGKIILIFSLETLFNGIDNLKLKFFVLFSILKTFSNSSNFLTIFKSCGLSPSYINEFGLDKEEKRNFYLFLYEKLTNIQLK